MNPSTNTSFEDPNGPSRSPDLYHDGSTFGLEVNVVFESDATDLVLIDANGTTDVFYAIGDESSGLVSTTIVSVSSVGTQGNGPSFDPVIAPTDIFIEIAFATDADNLVSFPTDTNGVTDVVVDRVGPGAPGLVSATTFGIGKNKAISSARRARRNRGQTRNYSIPNILLSL